MLKQRFILADKGLAEGDLMGVFEDEDVAQNLLLCRFNSGNRIVPLLFVPKYIPAVDLRVCRLQIVSHLVILLFRDHIPDDS